MNCTNCGTQLTGSEFTCPACGAPVQQGYQYQQNNQFPQNNAQGMNYAGDRSAGNYDPNLSFGGAVKLYFKNYVNFSGRASKREYWWSVLFAFLLSFTGIGGLVCFIGGLSIGIRRLHDIGKSGASILLCLIPFAGPIIMLVLYLRDSDPNPNQYGGGPALFASNFSPNARPDGAPQYQQAPYYGAPQYPQGQPYQQAPQYPQGQPYHQAPQYPQGQIPSYQSQFPNQQ